MTAPGGPALRHLLANFRTGTYRNAVHSAGWVMLGQVGAMTAALAGVRLLTSSLTPAAYGELALWLTVAALAQGLVQSPVAQAQLRMYSVARETNALAPYWAAARRLAVLSAVATVCICAGAVIVGPLFGARLNIAAAAATCVFAVMAGEFGRRTSVSIAAQRRPLAAAAQAGHEWLRVLLAVAAVRVIAAVPAAALLAFATSALVWTLVQARITHRAEPGLRAAAATADVVQWRGRLLVYAWPFAAWGVAAVLQGNIDRWVAGARGGATDAGLIAIIAQLGVAPIAAIAAAVSQFVAPILFTRIGDGGDPARVRKARRMVAALVVGALAATIAGAAVAYVLRDIVFGALVAPAFASAATLWPLGIAIGGLFAASQFASLMPMAMNRPAALLPVKIGHAVLAVTASVVGARLGGLRGVLWGALASNMVAVGWSCIVAWRVGAASTDDAEPLISPHAP